MNLRREKFCQAYARCGNAAEAARQAGYSSRTARTIGSMLLTKSDIAALIESTKAELKAQDDANHAQVQAELKAAAIESVNVLRSVLADPDATPSARVSAALGVLDRAGHAKSDADTGPQTIIVTGGLPLDPTK